MRNICWQFFFNGSCQFFIQHIAFADGNHKLFVQQFRIVFFQFIYKNFKFFFMIISYRPVSGIIKQDCVQYDEENDDPILFLRQLLQ